MRLKFLLQNLKWFFENFHFLYTSQLNLRGTLFDIVVFCLKSRSERAFLKCNFGSKMTNFPLFWTLSILQSPILDIKCPKINLNFMKIEFEKWDKNTISSNSVRGRKSSQILRPKTQIFFVHLGGSFNYNIQFLSTFYLNIRFGWFLGHKFGFFFSRTFFGLGRY